jgi:DNA ligase (NAD+)
MASVARQYQLLKEKISELDHAYYVLDQPKISDYEYDMLFEKLLLLEKQHPELDRADSPSQRVGGKPLEVFKKVDHRTPMLSLTNTYSADELTEFDERVKKFLRNTAEVEYFCEPKFDGLAIELIYQDGLFTQALTRGDGTTGEDVTQNVRTIRSVPLKLKTKKPPELLEVRGEILIFKKDFQELNEAQQEAGLQTFANPRNAAAGTIRQLDAKIAAARPLRFFAYSLGVVEGRIFETQEKTENTLFEWGLPIVQDLRRKCVGIQEVIDFYRDVESKREKIPFDIDGIVVKVNSFFLQNDLGLVARSPRWATAAKYKPAQAETVIEDIVVQVGRTGALTPVAIMSPVRVGGVTITNATLHNQDEIDRKDVRIGDTVLIQRAGDVIPEIVSVVQHRANSKPFKIPDQCPICRSKAIRLEDEIVFRCSNPLCPAIMKESLKHFASRRAMNIDKVGDKIIDAFADAGLIQSFSDFYKLEKKDVLSLERQGEKSAQNIIDSIKKSKKTTLARLIFSLGIRFVGEQTAKLLADHFMTVDGFLSATHEELLKVPEIGPKVATTISQWLKNSKMQKEVKKLIELGVLVENSNRKVGGPLSGLSFLITGTLPVKRDEAKDFIEEQGGKMLSSVSSKLNYLVVGDDPGSKLDKAQSLGVKIITWDELVKFAKTL